MDEPERLVEQLDLEPHPEGGFYRRVWTHPFERDGRALASTIYYLLTEGVTSKWHRIDAIECWVHSKGDPLELAIVDDRTDEVVRHDVGGTGESMVTVPAGAWQSARSAGEWSLMVVTVIPAFVWDGFELAPDGWEPGSSVG